MAKNGGVNPDVDQEADYFPDKFNTLKSLSNDWFPLSPEVDTWSDLP